MTVFDPKVELSLLPDCLDSERLFIQDSMLVECEALQLLNVQSDYISQWVGWNTPPDYAYKTITEGNLPPNGKRENFRVKSIYIRSSHELIGSIELYHGFPTTDTLCIGWLFIQPDHQKNGYAKEVVQCITEEATRAGFCAIHIGVHLKNWPALRFWTKMGFDRILDIIGDEFCNENTYASVILKKSLKQL